MIVPATAGVGGGAGRIALEPGGAWGDGSHETTQLCLQAIMHFRPRAPGGFSMLDFGSGSGILSIAAAQLGARVHAVEIAPGAIKCAQVNADLNGVGEQIEYWDVFPPQQSYDCVVANILKPVLMEFAHELASRASGTLILSGLVSTDIPELSVRYASLLGGRFPEIYRRGEWRALVWRTSIH